MSGRDNMLQVWLRGTLYEGLSVGCSSLLRLQPDGTCKGRLPTTYIVASHTPGPVTMHITDGRKGKAKALKT